MLIAVDAGGNLMTVDLDPGPAGTRSQVFPWQNYGAPSPKVVARRAMIGAFIGAACGVLALAGFGAWAGYTHGSGARFPPGWEAAVMGAFIYEAYFWWLAGPVGGIIGGLTGLGSWLARPRPPITRDT